MVESGFDSGDFTWTALCALTLLRMIVNLSGPSRKRPSAALPNCAVMDQITRGRMSCTLFVTYQGAQGKTSCATMSELRDPGTKSPAQISGRGDVSPEANLERTRTIKFRHDSNQQPWSEISKEILPSRTKFAQAMIP